MKRNSIFTLSFILAFTLFSCNSGNGEENVDELEQLTDTVDVSQEDSISNVAGSSENKEQIDNSSSEAAKSNEGLSKEDEQSIKNSVSKSSEVKRSVQGKSNLSDEEKEKIQEDTKKAIKENSDTKVQRRQ